MSILRRMYVATQTVNPQQRMLSTSDRSVFFRLCWQSNA
jgi:hypothetical protein